ncbi:MAG: FtsX-like permease family protein [Spirochaetes bacterium]|nr:FtsX-like permease family protein [Spirochaetota bacterium]
MKTIANIAFRNLSRQKKRSVLLGAAIAFGVMIVTLINGFAGAFVSNVSDNFSYLLAGHVFVSGVEKTGAKLDKEIEVIRDDAVLTAALKDAGVPAKYVTRRSDFDGSLIFEGKKVFHSIAGTDLANERFLRDRLVLKEGSWDNMKDPRAIVLSDKIAGKLNVQVGDRILVSLKTAAGQNNAGEFVLAGISFDTGILGSLMGYANIAYVNELLGLASGEYMTMGIMLDDISRTERSATALYDRMKASLQLFDRGVKDEKGATTPFMAMMRKQNREQWNGVKYRVFTLNDILAQVQQIVDAINIAAFVILVVLFFIVMVGITNTFRMVMYERIREIGTMRAVGVQRGEIRSMFLYEALFLAIGGALAGIVLALVAMAVISFFNLGMDSPLFIILKNGHLSFRVPPFQAVGNVLVIAVLTLAAAFFPARNAARLDPAVALRTLK